MVDVSGEDWRGVMERVERLAIVKRLAKSLFLSIPGTRIYWVGRRAYISQGRVDCLSWHLDARKSPQMTIN